VVGFLTDNLPVPPVYLTATPGQSTLTGSYSLNSRIDWTTVNTAFLGSMSRRRWALNNLVLGPETHVDQYATYKRSGEPD